MANDQLSSLLSGLMQNPEMMSKLSGIMSDPEAMKSIQSIAKGMSAAEPQAQSTALSLPNFGVQNENAKNRTRLISALKPYLNEERRDKADKLLGLLSLLELSGSTGLFKNQ